MHILSRSIHQNELIDMLELTEASICISDIDLSKNRNFKLISEEDTVQKYLAHQTVLLNFTVFK